MTTPATTPSQPPLPWRAIALLAASGLVVIGSMGPWARVFVFSVSGTEGDGVFTLILGVIAGVIALVGLMRPTNRARGPIGLVICFALSALIGIIDWSDLSGVAGEADAVVEVGWGLVVMTLAAIAGTVLSLSRLADVFLQSRRTSRAGIPEQQPPNVF